MNFQDNPYNVFHERQMDELKQRLQADAEAKLKASLMDFYAFKTRSDPDYLTLCVEMDAAEERGEDLAPFTIKVEEIMHRYDDEAKALVIDGAKPAGE